MFTMITGPVHPHLCLLRVRLLGTVGRRLGRLCFHDNVYLHPPPLSLTLVPCSGHGHCHPLEPYCELTKHRDMVSLCGVQFLDIFAGLYIVLPPFLVSLYIVADTGSE